MFQVATHGDSVTIARLGQSVQRVEYVDIAAASFVGPNALTAKHRIRLTIKTDTVKAQAYGRAERWDGTQWHTVHTVPGELLAAPKDLPYLRGADGLLSVGELERKFQPARAQLLEQLEFAIGF